MRGTLKVALKAYLHPRHQHCTDEAQKAETVLSAVSLIYIHIYIHIYTYIYIYIYIYMYEYIYKYYYRVWNMVLEFSTDKNKSL